MEIKERISGWLKKAKQEREVLKGKQGKDRTYLSRRIFKTEAQARAFFKEAKRRLFDIQGWSKIPKLVNSEFQLYSLYGEPYFNKKPFLHDYIRIQLPGPFPENWVKIISIKEGEGFAEFTVRPSENPSKKNIEDQTTDHFFHSGATSTFRVVLKKNVVYAYEIGKNEVVNNSKPEAGNRPVVNTVIAGGGWAGIQKMQWKNLTDYLVGKNDIASEKINWKLIVSLTSGALLGLGLTLFLASYKRKNKGKSYNIQKYYLGC